LIIVFPYFPSTNAERWGVLIIILDYFPHTLPNRMKSPTRNRETTCHAAMVSRCWSLQDLRRPWRCRPKRRQKPLSEGCGKGIILRCLDALRNMVCIIYLNVLYIYTQYIYIIQISGFLEVFLEDVLIELPIYGRWKGRPIILCMGPRYPADPARLFLEATAMCFFWLTWRETPCKKVSTTHIILVINITYNTYTIIYKII
jgi:hypothetical protein